MNKPPRLYRETRVTAVSIGLAFTAIAVLTSILHVRAGSADQVTKINPLPVASTRFEEQSSYLRTVSYLGLVKAKRKTDLGFEMSGLLVAQRVREGSSVKTGDILAELDDATLKAQQKGSLAELQRVEAELELARIKESRQQELRDSGAVSREAYDETRLRAQALVAQTQVVLAQLERLDIQLKKSVIRAPYDGVIAQRYIDVGTVAAAGTPILRIVETANWEAHIGVSLAQAENLLPGNDYSLSLRGNSSQAKLLAIRPDVDPVTRAVTAIFQLPASAVAIDGETVNLLLTQPVEISGGWVPLSALLEGERGAWTVLKIAQVGSSQIAVREVVEVLETQGDMAYVRGTVGDGELLMANGVHKVTPGTQVTQVK